MPDYTTVTLSKDVKEQLSSGMAEDETWSDYLQRLHSENIESETAELTDRLSKDDLNRVRMAFQEVAQHLDTNDQEPARVDSTEIDYDHLREIVRDEVRQALEELIR